MPECTYDRKSMASMAGRNFQRNSLLCVVPVLHPEVPAAYAGKGRTGEDKIFHILPEIMNRRGSKALLYWRG